MIKKDGEIYYTINESKDISDENIIRSAESLVEELRQAKQNLINKKEIYV